MMETPSTMTPTLMPTTAPTILVTASTMASGQSDNYFKDNMTWMVLWVITLVVFLVFPFATSKRRRMLCARGIRERRWIPDEEIEEELRREEMQQRMEAVRTQEDSIRRQYLSFLMQRYTVELKDADILDNENEGDVSVEEISKSIGVGKEESMEQDVENQCEATVISSEIGSSRDTIDSDESHKASDIEALAPVRENRADSEDSEDLLAVEFEKGLKVSVPLAGHSNDSKPSRRLVSNGCAICLCQFEGGEKLTYSSNPDCCHVFHDDCIINWYIAVGRKTQRKRRKNNPNMTEEEYLNAISDFPINCPCCRQKFSTDSTLSCEKVPESGDDDVEESSENLANEEV